MGMYMFVNERDRIIMRRASDPEINEALQDALKYDPSLLIEEVSRIKRSWFKRSRVITYWNIYHETHPFDEIPYQARYQISASGEKGKVIAYLYGIINGAINCQNRKP